MYKYMLLDTNITLERTPRFLPEELKMGQHQIHHDSNHTYSI